MAVGAYSPVIYSESTFTPTVTLVGGAGNTVPVYSTNTGRYTRVGRAVHIDIYLAGDGGAEGAGTGEVNIALPFTVSSSFPTGYIPIGTAVNNATYYVVSGQVDASANVIRLAYFSLLTLLSTFTGADQNNATRNIRLQFRIEV